MFIVPFTQDYPYQLDFTLTHIISVINDEILLDVYIQSLFVAIATAFWHPHQFCFCVDNS